jgi:phage host-nuclease inhibitor protein Gam
MSKTKQLEVSTWPDAEILLLAFAEEQAALDRTQARLDAALARAREAHAEALRQAEESLAQTSAALKRFAAAHRREFRAKEEGGEGRVREIHGVLYGYRLAPPKVRIPKKKLEAAMAWLEEFGEDTYVRRDPELARDRLRAELMAAEAAKDTPFLEKLAGHGITLEQDEDFVLEVPKAE